MEPGTQIERWEIVRRLGAGGQADVFEARHLELGLRGALKVLKGSSSADRLITEGRVLARLQHTNLGRVLDVLRVDDRPALVLEYIDGPTLAAWLAERRRPWAALAPVLAAVLDGVEAAHAAGVVHRDLKPANVLLAPGPVPKVVDFGIARDPEGDGGTHTGAAMGTPRYMAPEQLRSAASVDTRADVWALGALIYEATTGRPPFEDADLIGLHAAFQARAYVDPHTLATDLPASVGVAIRGALEPEREHRIPDVATLRAVLAGAPWAPPGRDPTWESAPEDTKPAIPGVVLGARSIDGALERWTARTPGGIPVTVRIGDGDGGERLRREAEVLQSLPATLRVVRAIGAGTLADGRAWLATLDAPGTPLPTWSGTRRTRDELHAVIHGALETAAALHALSPPVWVRDWSPARLAIAADGPWLTELGLVRATPADPLLGGHTFEGSFGYVAPEQLHGDSESRTDVWGIGALAVALFTRRDPRTIRRGPALEYAAYVDLPADWCAALDAMLAEEPAARPDAAVALARWRALRQPAPRPPRPGPDGAPSPAAARPDPAGPRPFKDAEPVAAPSVEDFHRPPAVRRPAAPAAPRAKRPTWLPLAGVAAVAFIPLLIVSILTGASPISVNPDATRPPPVAAPAPPAEAPTGQLKFKWATDGTLTVSRDATDPHFGAVPVGPRREPVFGDYGITNPGFRPQTCKGTILVDEGGHPLAVKVEGCEAEPAKDMAMKLIEWRYAPTGALVSQTQEIVFQ